MPVINVRVMENVLSPEQKQLADAAFRASLTSEPRKHHAAKSTQPAPADSAAKQ